MSLNIEQVLKTLPAMTKEVESLLNVLKQDFVEPKILEAKLVACPVISGRVLQISNSSFYGLSREISSLREATIILGQHTLRSLIYSLAAMDQFKADPKSASEDALDYEKVWHHSLLSACLARVMAEYKKVNSADIFTAALFQNFGILILDSIEKQKVSAALKRSREKNMFLLDALEDETGINFIGLSAEALNIWHFPVSVCQLIHSVKDRKQFSDTPVETQILLYANLIARSFLNSPLRPGSHYMSNSAIKLFTPQELAPLLPQADDLFAQMASSFIG